MERKSHAVPQYKMVFLVDDTVHWSPMDIFRGSKDIKANTSLKIKTKFQVDGSRVVNMFEAPIDSVCYSDTKVDCSN